MSHPIRKTITAGALALAGASAAAAPAHAGMSPPKVLNYTCKYPLVDKQPLEVVATTTIPTQAKLNELQPAFAVKALATAGGNTSQAITTLNAQAIDGVGQATASLHYPSGFVQEGLTVDLTVDKWLRPQAVPVPNPLVLTASGSTPSLVFDEEGRVDVVLDKIALNLRAFKADGTPINVKKLTSDFDGNPVPTDTTPDDFNVYCKLDTGEDTVIARVCVSPDGLGTGCEIGWPTGPQVSGLRVDSKTLNSVALSWYPATDPSRNDAVSYNVYRGGVKVGTTDGTSFIVTGLAPGTEYALAVEATYGTPEETGAKETIFVTTDTYAADRTPPTVPVSQLDLQVKCSGSKAVLSWTPSTDGPNGSGIQGYRITRGSEVINVPATTTSYTFASYSGGPFTASVAAIDVAGNVSAAAEVSGDGPVIDCSAPSTPGDGVYTEADVGEDYLVVRWGASTDGSGGAGLKGYVVELEGEEYFVPAGTTFKRFDGLAPDTEYYFYVRAIDNAGTESEEHTEFLITKRPNAAPSQVTGLKVDSATATSVQLSWGASTDPDGDAIRYDVFQGTTKVTSVSGTSATVTGLAAGTDYSFTVVAVDAKGKAAPASAAVHSKAVEEPPTTLDYGLKGSTTLKTLTTGKLPLTGGIKAVPDFAAGTFTADLTLNNTSGRLVAAGFLPITAKVGFVPVGKTTGTLDDATATKPAGITTNSKVRIKVLEVKLFGAIPLAGGNSCQTKSVSDITLKSTNAFDPFKGGSIAGTYKISDLNGCGALNGLVSPLTAGGGNTIALDLAYKG